MVLVWSVPSCCTLRVLSG